MRRALCLLLGHRLPAGWRREFTFRFVCARCGRLVNGGL